MSDPANALDSIIGSGPVIVGVDGSSNAQRALRIAADIARRFDLDLAVFHAIGLMTVIDGHHVPSEGHRDDLERLLRLEWCAACWPANATFGGGPNWSTAAQPTC